MIGHNFIEEVFNSELQILKHWLVERTAVRDEIAIQTRSVIILTKHPLHRVPKLGIQAGSSSADAYHTKCWLQTADHGASILVRTPSSQFTWLIERKTKRGNMILALGA